MDEWITDLIDSLGYVGVAFLMLVENVFPPIPSEIVMPLAGFAAARGEMSIVGVILAGSIGSVLGATFWYIIARWLGERWIRVFVRRYGRWLTLTLDDIDNVDHWFDRYGRWVVMFGRLIPGVRTLVSIPAGVFGMSLPVFVLFTAIGTTLWAIALGLLGYWLGDQYQSIGAWLAPVSTAVIIGAVAYYIYRVVTFKRRR